jgi:hypothetical protein
VRGKRHTYAFLKNTLSFVGKGILLRLSHRLFSSGKVEEYKNLYKITTSVKITVI